MENSQSLEGIEMASTSQKNTFEIGFAIPASLYHESTTIWLRGDLGAGKTTLVQGLGKGLGIEEITSPTYALENRYGEKLLHIDLYRLDEKEARRVVEESADFPGVRAIEWSERLEGSEGLEGDEGSEGQPPLPSRPSLHSGCIDINLEETSASTRSITITFADIPFPSRSDIESWRYEVRLPDHIGMHCDAVGTFAKKCGEELLQRGIPCRPEAVRIAGELHDLLRFVDFTPDGTKKIPHAEEADELTKAYWADLAKRYPGRHEEACARFVSERGYPELGNIIMPHGLRAINEPELLRTIEQKILFYADKRVQFDQVVSLDERFADFVHRYGNGVESDQAKQWKVQTKALEWELFGENIVTA